MNSPEDKPRCPVCGTELVHAKGALGEDEPWVCMQCGYEEGGVSGSP